MNKGFCFIIILWFAISCKHSSAIEQIEEGNKVITLNVPKGFPYPNIPADNQPTQNRIDLGLKLFNDPILSRDSTISCASCHQADKYFTDNLFLSLGIENRRTERNSPSLLNVAYQPNMFWDGGNPTLEQQVLAPIADHQEMDYDVIKVVERLHRHPQYPNLFLKAYNQQPSVFALTRAIACYERTLFSGNSKYDQFLQTRDSSVFTTSEKNGLKLFFNEQGDCFHCHQGFNMTDFSFQNNGLYAFYVDSGRARITQRARDIGKFKVPSLRDIEKTAPYMHDGSKQTLEEVINHYNSGGMKHPNKSAVLRPLNLSDQDKIDLVNFLKTLTSSY